MNKLKRAVLAVLFCLAVSLTITSCDVLDVDPSQDIGADVALSSVEGYTALLAAAYDDMQDVSWYGQYFMLVPDALADNIESEGGIRYAGFISNARGAHLTRYGDFYGTINKANVIITGIDELTIEGVSEEEAQEAKDRLKGAAYFMRALSYFDLIRTKSYEPEVVPGVCSSFEVCDAGVIIRTEPSETVDEALQLLSRAPIEEVYALIEQDLLAAMPLLEAPQILGANEIFVANKAAAQALLAQVYLYWKRHGDAADMASQAMATAQDELGAEPLTEENYVAALSGATHPSGILVVNMDPNTDGSATNSNEGLSSLSYDCESFNFQLIPTQDLINAHEPGDVRLGLYETLFCPIVGSTLTRLNKYTNANGVAGTYTDDVVVLRLAEVLLIRAEAYAESGQEALALADLNDLRSRRGLDDVNLSGQALIDQILQAKRLELAFEGERFFDLKRRGMDIPKPQDISEVDVLPYSYEYILAPLPSTEVLNNPNLLQNWGYQ